jgi:hypothetical protein
MITGKGIAGALAPFVPVLVGIVLKFCLLDQPKTDIMTHFKMTYISSIWIDFIITAYISGIAWFLVRKLIDARSVVVLLIVPLVCFVICVALTLGLAKAGVANEFLTLYLPALIAAFSVAASGNALAVG